MLNTKNLIIGGFRWKRINAQPFIHGEELSLLIVITGRCVNLFEVNRVSTFRGEATYVATAQNSEAARMTIRDSTYEGYSLVPCITYLEGTEEGILLILDWMMRRIKGPLLSYYKYRILIEYGFVHWKTQLVWNPPCKEEESLAAREMVS